MSGLLNTIQKNKSTITQTHCRGLDYNYNYGSVSKQMTSLVAQSSGQAEPDCDGSLTMLLECKGLA